MSLANIDRHVFQTCPSMFAARWGELLQASSYGIGAKPPLNAQGFNSIDVIEQIESSCNRSGGLAPIPAEARQKLESIAKILNIGWIAAGAAKDASIICPRSSACPRDKPCLGRRASRLRPQIDEIRENLLRETV